MRRLLTVFLFIIIVAASASAQPTTAQPVNTPPCDPETNPSTCTIGEAFTFFRKGATQAAPAAAAAAAATVADKSGEEVETSNRATEPPNPFAAQLHNSYQDFLNLLSFAINKVEESEDGQALTVRFNPIRGGSDVFGGTVTAARPSVADGVKTKLPETGRTDTVRQLEGQLGELDDLTFSVSWARQTETCKPDRNSSDRCFGREPDTYRDWLSRAIARTLAPSDANDINFDLVEGLADEVRPVDGSRPSVFRTNLGTGTFHPGRTVERIKALVSAEAAVDKALNALYTKERVADLASLIDNQPQFTSSLNYHDAGRYGGGPVTSVSFELQFGNANINAIRSACGSRGSDCHSEELEKRLIAGVSTLKWVFSGSYIRNDSYKLADLGGVTVPDGFLVDLPSSRAITLKAQGGGQLSRMIGDKRMRADGSIEFERITSKDNAQRKNRFVAKGTFTVPIGDNMSVPVSVTWANKEKFLGDQTDKFGMHLGISYRIPELFKKKN